MLMMVTGRHHITWGKLKTHIFILLGNSPYGGGGVRKGSPWTGYVVGVRGPGVSVFGLPYCLGTIHVEERSQSVVLIPTQYY